LDLWNGSAWFSGWFRQRLQWPAEADCRKLDALRPYLAPGAWEALLRGIRAHLEEQVPLDVQIEVRVNGRLERWRVEGSAERSPAGQPVCLVGSMCEAGAVRPPVPLTSKDDA
jgi:hypothetical protein